MSVNLMRRKVIYSFLLLFFSLSLFIFSSYAYFTDLFTDSFTGEIGFVDVDLEAYFYDPVLGEIQATEIVIDATEEATASDVSFATSTISSTTINFLVYSSGDKIRIDGSTSNDGIYTVTGTPTANALVVVGTLTGESAGSSITTDLVLTKPGVYFVNIISNDGDNYFENFRLKILVKSNINTYFRVKIYEQLTLIYTDFQGEVTELSILFDGQMPFDYDLVNWYDNRNYDNYMYYQNAVQRTNETTSLEIGLISGYTLPDFSVYSPGYSLQIAFSIEAIQSEDAPNVVWGLATPPWGGSW